LDFIRLVRRKSLWPVAVGASARVCAIDVTEEIEGW